MTIATAAIAADVNSVTIAGRRFEISTAVSTGTMSNHGEMLNVVSNAASIVAVSAADAGDEVTVTSYYNYVDYRETNKACLITVYGIYFNCDVVFDNVNFVVTGSAKPWYLLYNDLTVTSGCGLYTNSAGSSA